MGGKRKLKNDWEIMPRRGLMRSNNKRRLQEHGMGDFVHKKCVAPEILNKMASSSNGWKKKNNKYAAIVSTSHTVAKKHRERIRKKKTFYANVKCHRVAWCVQCRHVESRVAEAEWLKFKSEHKEASVEQPATMIRCGGHLSTDVKPSVFRNHKL